MKKITLLIPLLLACAAHLAAQRYLQPVFSQVNVKTVTYGSNFTILPIIIGGGRPARQSLVANVYTPAGDVDQKRPLIIYLKTGNFFPFPINGSCGGALNDSSNVEIATRLAKMGYVVAVANYRGGWFPTASDPANGELVRRSTLLNAVYRGVQDVRTCIRFFRRNVEEADNQFGIDPDKIVVWGQGTGGYLSLAAAYLNTYNEILTTTDPNKFKIQGQIPMVTEMFNGDIYGTSGPCVITDPANPVANPFGMYKQGDTLCVPNHIGYSSAFRLCVNMSGALCDSTWLDGGEMPLVSYHVPTDFFSPCKTRDLGIISDPGPMPIVEVTGSCDLHRIIEQYGNNNIFEKILPALDQYGPIAKARNGGASGFFPFISTPKGTSSPWEWTSYAGTPPPAAGTDCNLKATSARIYIDTIIEYFAIRACVGLDLPCGSVSGIGNLPLVEMQMTIVPNPATSQVLLSAPEDAPFRAVDLFDVNGRLLRSVRNLNVPQYTFDRGGLPSGMYIVRAYFEKGVRVQRLVFE